MRKYFLLIIYLTGPAFMQYGLNAAPFLFAVDTPGNIIPQIVKSDNYVCKCSCGNESNFCSLNLNFEEDDDVKSKPVYAAGFLLDIDIRFIAIVYQLKNIPSFSSTSTRNLFKLNRALRL